MSIDLGTPTKLTAMHNAHQELGAMFVDRDGWNLPARYFSTGLEVARAIGGGGICDISPVGKLTFQGNDVLKELARALSLPEPPAVGKAMKCASPTASEDSRESVTVAGLTYDEAMVITSPWAKDSVAGALGDQLGVCAHMIDVTSVWAGLAVVGPRSRDVLSKLVELDLDPREFVDGACAQGKAAEVHVLVIRGDLSDLEAYQVYVTRDYGEYLWHALLHAGKNVWVGPIGIEAFERISADSSGIPW